MEERWTGRKKSLGHEMGRRSEKGGERERLGRDGLRVVVVCGGRCVGVMGLGREKCWGERWTGAGDGMGRKKGWEGDGLGKEMDWGGKWVAGCGGLGSVMSLGMEMGW